LRPQSLQRSHDSLQVLPELANLHTPACFRPGQQPFPAALVDFDGAGVVVLGDMQVDHSHLQDAAVQVAHRAGFSPPGCLERLMGFEITSLVEELHAMDGLGMQGTLTVGNSRYAQIGHIEENYIIGNFPMNPAMLLFRLGF